MVNARDVKNVPGRPKTDKLDAVWLAKLTEKGLLRPSFVPPPAIRVLRDYTRLRVDLTQERTRYWHPTPSPNWTRSEQWTPTERCRSRPVCPSPPSAQGGDRNGNRATDAVHNRASRHSQPACSPHPGATAEAGRNQHMHGCPREIGSAVLRSRESP